ncbi:MAG: glycosyltransferase family 9 protein, partial [Thiohalocapsa sp.]
AIADRIGPAAATQTAAKPPITLAIEQMGLLAGGAGMRVSLSGWALANAAIAEIAAAVNGEVVANASYGLARPDIAILHPERADAAESGFVLVFDLPHSEHGAAPQPVLTVRTADGDMGHHPLRFTVPPARTPSRIVDPLDPAPSPFPEPIVLALEKAAVDPGGVLQISGWAVCLGRLAAIEVWLDGEPLGAAEYGRVRPDIEERCRDYPNPRFSGLRLSADVTAHGAGRKTVTVVVRSRDGIAAEAGAVVEVPTRPAPRRPPPVGFRHHVDVATLTTDGRLTLSGWTLAAAPAAAIAVVLDGEPVGEALLGIASPELGNLFPMLPHARQCGFAFAATAGRTVGEHTVSLKVMGADGRSDEVAIPLAARQPSRGGILRQDPDRKLHVDAPLVIGGAAATPVRGNLQIAGWALARAGMQAIEISVDGRPLALADYGLRRLDVHAALPDWEGALASGYQALLPHRILPRGEHTLAITLRDRNGGEIGTDFRIVVEDLSDRAGPWSLRRRMPPAEHDLYREILAHRDHRVRFVALLPVADDNALRQAEVTLRSLAAQLYPEWRLLVAMPAAETMREPLLAAAGPAIADRTEIVAELTAPLPAEIAADPEAYVTLLTPGDELGVDAFLEMALALAAHPEADFLYSDERRDDLGSGAVGAFFKPQWSPALLLSINYIGRLWAARAPLLQKIGREDLPENLLGGGEYDLVLRLTEQANAIRHVPAVLCQRAATPTDDAQDQAADQAALARALVRRGIAGAVEPAAAGGWRVRRALTRPGLVSIVIPTCAAGGLIETCLETLRRLTAYRDYEIVCIENIAAKDRKWRGWLRRNADRVTATQEPFNWARFSNLAAREAKGEYLLFMNDDIEIIEPGWLDALLEHAQRPEIGVVGPLLLYPDRRVQHAGMFLAAMGQARHAFRYAAADDPGYFGLLQMTRNVIAVTGACLMTRRDVFDALGGFDETQSIVNNDLDYALRARQRGLATIYTPHARLVHHESISRAGLEDAYDEAVFDSKWREVFVAGDPYFSPHLSKHHDDFAADDEPTQQLVTGRPALRGDEVRNILVIKLDHIGDCVIAFPAVRRLKQLFPEARITVLTSNASRPIWALEPSVDATIAFDFFHARSGLGEMERSDEDWQELRARLTPEAFDLAVDLRKHTETRPVLQYTGAQILAGFDFRNEFPWLDIALEWSGDQIYARKRQHNADDAINLVDALAAACEADRRMIVAAPVAIAPPALPDRRDGGGPLVYVHPTVGNDARQWPIEYFAAVIDRLIAEDAARVVLIGAPGEEAVAAALVERVRHKQRVTSLVGKVPLADLPAVLAGGSLFLGNNSGPKHIAAGLGVPTVGVHSGTEDVREWGPVGPHAVAVARDMVCAPCYLPYAADCRRGLACLRELEPARVYDACKRLLLLNGSAPAPLAETQEDAAAGAAAATPGSPRRRPRRSARPLPPGSP